MEQSNVVYFTPGTEDFSGGSERAMPVTVAAGTYKRGEVLGRLENTYGKLSVANAKPAAIMPFDIVIDADKTVTVYVSGEFNEDKLIIGDQNLENVKTALRDVGIFARKWGVAPDVA